MWAYTILYIKTRVHQQNSAVYIVGCPCHMVHNMAVKAVEAFQSITGFDIEDFLIDLYNWFDKSTKRKNKLAEFCSFCNTEYRQVVKHVSTRWLSLECAVKRSLKQYVSLQSYFLSLDEAQIRFKRLKRLFENPLTEVYHLFYQAVMPLFTSFNKFLQRETPCIHLIMDKIESFFSNLISKSLTVQAIKEAKQDSKLYDINFHEVENQLTDATFFISFTTKQSFQKLLRKGDIDEQNFNKFYEGARTFFITAADYVIKTYPVKVELLKCATFVDFDKCDKVTFSDVEYFIHRFLHLEHLQEPKEIEALQQQFVLYQLL